MLSSKILRPLLGVGHPDYATVPWISSPSALSSCLWKKSACGRPTSLSLGPWSQQEHPLWCPSSQNGWVSDRRSLQAKRKELGWRFSRGNVCTVCVCWGGSAVQLHALNYLGWVMVLCHQGKPQVMHLKAVNGAACSRAGLEQAIVLWSLWGRYSSPCSWCGLEWAKGKVWGMQVVQWTLRYGWHFWDLTDDGF